MHNEMLDIYWKYTLYIHMLGLYCFIPYLLQYSTLCMYSKLFIIHIYTSIFALVTSFQLDCTPSYIYSFSLYVYICT